MNQATFRSALIPTVVHVGTHLFLWLVFVAAMIFYVPKSEAEFTDFKLKVPDLTIYIMDLSHWIIEYWFLFPFLISILSLLDAAVFFLLRIGAKGRSASRLWSALMILLPLAGLGITLLALSLPHVKVLEDLSK